MIWFVFDMNGFPEPLHLSLRRAFARQARRGGAAIDSHLFAASADHNAIPSAYYLRTEDGTLFNRLIRQFGGKRCTPPSPEKVREVKQENDPKASVQEMDSTPC